MEVLSISTEQTKELAYVLANKLKANDILALYGDLGSGKTTFTSFLVSALGINKRVQSPTFVLHRRYSDDSKEIKVVNHLDLYRIASNPELEDLHLEEIFTEPDSISIVEWPDIAKDKLPERTIKIYFEYIDENVRKINVHNLY